MSVPPNAPFTSDANTLLLMHFNSDFTDSSFYARTVTAEGSAAVSTLQSKFGSGSLLTPNLTNVAFDYLTTPDSPELSFGTGDFTIELWIYPLGYPETNADPVSKNVDDNPGGWFFEILGGAGQTTFLTANPDGSENTYALSGLPNLNAWNSIVAQRNSGFITIWLNGTASENYADTTDLSGNSAPITIGDRSIAGFANRQFQGYIDELRISKVARYSNGRIAVTNMNTLLRP